MASPHRIASQLRGLLSAADKRRLMQRLVLIAEANVKREAPVQKGTLRRSITSRVESVERGVVGTNLKYARYVNDGTRPHVIRPKRARALYWPKAAHPVRMVRHPGTKANAFMQRGADKSQPEFEREGARFGVDVFARVG